MARGLAAPQADAIAEEVYDDDDDDDDDDDGSVDSDPYDLSAPPQVLRWVATRRNALQRDATPAGMQRVATRCNGMQRQLGCNALQRVATRCNGMQRQLGCNALQRVAMGCNASWDATRCNGMQRQLFDPYDVSGQVWRHVPSHAALRFVECCAAHVAG
jgi:hypothetical protein